MIYEFQCEECEHNFTRSLPMAKCKEPLNEPCPACNKVAVKRVFGVTIVSGAMDVHTRAEKVGGEAYKEVMKNVKKAGGKFGNVNI
jgi:putative FmdB family regulatory protein